jgi:type I site-specific restriction endonuclease
MKPEEEARKKIDVLLEKAGWQIQDQKDLNTLLSLKAQNIQKKKTLTS